MTAADLLTVKNGIPIIMGANIGTSVTNTIVSMGSLGDRINLQRAFSGATVHDMFNFLTVITLLPIEAIIGAMQGEGGPLYWLTYAITEDVRDGEGGEELFDSPIKAITKPFVKQILAANKYVIYALVLGRPEEGVPTGGHCGQCQELEGQQNFAGTEECSAITTTTEPDERRLAEASSDEGDDYTRSLLSKRQLQSDNGYDCSKFTCVSKSMAKYFKKTAEDEFDEIVKCDSFFPDEPCGSQICMLEGASFYDEYMDNGRIIKGGFLKGAGDTAGGTLGLVISLLFLCLGLLGLTTCLKKIFMGQAKKVIAYSTKLNDYLAVCIGVGITIVVQSSSVTTSALTPLCAIGALPLRKMLPMTLGANIGTTCTALIASMVDMKPKAIQIALCHLFFNIIGILIWFPVPYMRQIPLTAAKTLGLYASYYRFVPVLYIFVAFVLMPGVFLGLSASYDAHVVLGLLLTLVILAALGAFVFWWNRGINGQQPGHLKVLDEEQRRKGDDDLMVATAEVLGLTKEEAIANEKEPLSWFGF